MPTLNLPLTSNDEGQIIDAQGREIADCWAVDERGNIRVNDATVPAMQATAAEIVRRVNAHEEQVEALRKIGTYPKARRDEMSAPAMRLLARTTLSKIGIDVYGSKVESR